MSRYFTLFACLVIVTACGTANKAQQAQQQQYPNYGGYYPQGQPGYYPQAQQGIPQNQQPVYQQQYQSQQGADAAGFVEVKRSPIEELSLATGTNEMRAYGQAESGNEQLALNAAHAQAITALRKRIESFVEAAIEQYNNEAGVPMIDASTQNVVKVATRGFVNGAKILDTRKLYNPNTKRFKYEMCVTIDRAGVMSVMQQQSDRIHVDKKLFEQDMQSAWDAIDAQNNRVSLGEQQQMRQNEMQQSNLDREHQRNMQYQNQQNQYNLESQRIQSQNQSPQGE